MNVTKQDEIRNPNSCLNKAGESEPIFVLRAKDLTSPNIIRSWAELNKGTLDKEKYYEAIELADKMEEWQGENEVNFPD